MKVKNLVFCLFILTILISCTSIQTDIHYDSSPTDSIKNLEVYELELVNLRSIPNSFDLEKLTEKLSILSSSPSTAHKYQARINALEAEAYLLGNKKSLAEKKLKQALKSYAGDEIAIIVQSRLAKTNIESIEILKSSLQIADENYKIQAELGNAFAKKGEYREAVAFFDSSLPFLDEAYQNFYGNQREKAWALRDSETAPLAELYISKNNLPLKGMINITNSNSNAFDWLTGGANWGDSILFERLKTAGWFPGFSSSPNNDSTKQDAAHFLWYLMTQNNESLKTKYTARYASRLSSPIPDVPYSSPYFDAILGTVEEDIIELTDGKNFSPDEKINGLQFWEWLQKALKWR